MRGDLRGDCRPICVDCFSTLEHGLGTSQDEVRLSRDVYMVI
jgi:hypothetical protein